MRAGGDSSRGQSQERALRAGCLGCGQLRLGVLQHQEQHPRHSQIYRSQNPHQAARGAWKGHTSGVYPSHRVPHQYAAVQHFLFFITTIEPITQAVIVVALWFGCFYVRKQGLKLELELELWLFIGFLDGWFFSW